MGKNIKKIEYHKNMKIIFPENCKKYVEMQDAVCWEDKNSEDYIYKIFSNPPEVKNIGKLLSKLKPKNILELGSGIGRMSVYLKNYYNWNDTNLYLLDGYGEKIVAGITSELGNNFYNSMEATKEFCLANNIKEDKLFLINGTKIFNNECMLGDFIKDVKFDLIYSFAAVGFHWTLEYYLTNLYNNLSDNCYLIFQTRDINPIDCGSPRRARKIKKFVDRVINSIDTSKYKIITKTLESWPAIIILKRRNK
jgi:SAM-dependent methyltransferase